MVEPLFKTPGSYYYQQRPRDLNLEQLINTDLDDEEWVDHSIPSTPLGVGLEEEEMELNWTGSTSTRDGPSMVPKQEEGKSLHVDDVSVKSEVDDSDRSASATPLREITPEENLHGTDGPIDDRQCRICLAGSEEEALLGRLISPCLCTGSMRYVHVSCINTWRGTGSNSKAFLECPQCHHQYRLRRTLVAGLATSKPVILLLSAVVFNILTLSSGHLMHLLLSRPAISNRVLNPQASRTVFDMFDEDDLYDYYEGGTVIYVSGGGTLIWDVLVGAVQLTVSVMENLAESQRGWMDKHTVLGPLLLGGGVRFLLGLSVLGSMSFISLLLSLSLFAPLQLVNGMRGAGILGSWGRRRQGGGNGTQSSFGQFMIFAIILIGAVNTLFSVYHTVEFWTQKGLRYVETQILEVNPEERRRERERARARREESWWRRWIREGRWKTKIGWQELFVRTGIRIRLAIRNVRDRWRAAWLMNEAGF